MREHKYRIWDVENQEMITGDEKYIDISNGDIISSGFSCHVVLDPKFNILMQYIGLTDNNGVEIYEGDIVRYVTSCDVSNHYECVEFERETIGVVSLTASKGVVLNSSKYRETTEGEHLPDLNFIKSSYARSFSASKSEVIGSIYENQELLNR